MKNNGKRFEESWKKSIPKNIFYYRFRDSSNTWSNGDKTRFTPSNIADCLIFNGEHLYLLELKSTKGKSLPFGNIKEHQIDDLLKADKYEGVICGLVIEFSDINECYFIEIKAFKDFYDNTNRKSLPVEYLATRGIKIGVEKLRANRRFDIEKFINDVVYNVTEIIKIQGGEKDGLFKQI